MNKFIQSAKLIYHINDKWNVEAGILKQRVDRGTQNQTLKLTSDSTYTATVSLQGDPGRFGIVSHLININGTAKTGVLSTILLLVPMALTSQITLQIHHQLL